MNRIYQPTKSNESGKRYCMQFFKNVDYLREKRGITFNEMVRQIYEQEGFKVNRSAVNRYKRGLYWSARISYLDVYARFLGVSLPYLLSCDLEQEERVNEDLRGLAGHG